MLAVDHPPALPLCLVVDQIAPSTHQFLSPGAASDKQNVKKKTTRSFTQHDLFSTVQFQSGITFVSKTTNITIQIAQWQGTSAYRLFPGILLQSFYFSLHCLQSCGTVCSTNRLHFSHPSMLLWYIYVRKCYSSAEDANM